MEIDELTLGVESEALMGALEVVRDMLQGRSAESLQLESSMKNRLEDSVDLVYNTYRAREIYHSVLERMVSETEWSESDYDMLRIINSGRYWESLSEDMVGDVDEFQDRVMSMFNEFSTDIDADFDTATLGYYVSTADMFYYLEDGLRERYGFE